VVPALLLLGSCASEAYRHIPAYSGLPEYQRAARPFTVTAFRGEAEGQAMPEWVEHWLEGGIAAVEALAAHQGRHVFISRNEGVNFNALAQWAQWFIPELDFPRLAAARIQERFLYGVSRPEIVYGPFFVALVRAASDAPWAGAVKEDYFWIRREFYLDGNDTPEWNNNSGFTEEDWEFLILVTIDKDHFASQLDAVFRDARPASQPTREQQNAANRVIELFFEGF